jgi:hypothetical protein
MARKPSVGPSKREPVLCPVFDQVRGRPCGEPAEEDSLTCKVHRARPTRTQLSRIDAARKRYG